jgi:hypothetical protein
MTANYCGILTLEIIGFFTALIYHGKLPQYFYNIGPWFHFRPKQLKILKVSKVLLEFEKFEIKVEKI